MRIAIDAHSVGTQLGGNESYATNLIEALAQIDSTNQYTVFVTKKEGRERFGNRWPNFQVRLTLPHTPLVRIPLTLSAELRRNPVDVLHVQFTAPPFCPCPTVVSIHDLSFEHLPQTFKRRSRAQLRLTVRRSARNAAQIIALSAHGRQDLIDTYRVPAERINVIPLAPSPRFAPVKNDNELRRVRQIYGIDGDYILSVGSIQPRKNLRRLIAAYSLLRQERPAVKLPKLVLVGKKAWFSEETLQALEAPDLSGRVVVTGYVPETDLPALYSGALCFIYPSYFEGFGLPPLEAMQCGSPVIVGNQTSLPEVVGDAALMVDPFDVAAISSALHQMIIDPEMRSTLSAKGLVHASRFDWKDTARQTLAVYRKAYVNRPATQSLKAN